MCLQNIKAYLAQPSNVQDLHAALLDMMARVLRPGGAALGAATLLHVRVKHEPTLSHPVHRT